MGANAGEVTAEEAWQMLSEDPKAVLVDVRTPPEWQFVGIPDLRPLGKQTIFLPWQMYPGAQLNPNFAEALKQRVDPDAAVLFICRSGNRSRDAAVAMAGEGYSRCYNVREGFEGPRDEKGHRGHAGWRAAGLPWVQD